MLQHREHLEAVVVQPEQRADADIVDARDLRAVHSLQPVVEVRLGAGGVDTSERLAVVGLLEQRVRADLARVLEAAEVGDRERRDLDVDSPDVAAWLGAHAGDNAHNAQEIVEGVLGVLAGEQKEPAVAHLLERLHLVLDLVIGQVRACDVLVLCAEGAVRAAVHAVVGEVERREEDDAVAIDPLFDVERRAEQLRHERAVARVDVEQRCSLLHVEPLHVLRL
mmetsp:Transcript_22693/g.58392  ORF Transcript_22693/g.58392 Transcript_22693/m.58392 type:complete len:223 (+) Transcript_22693:929-1597(+)